MRGEADVRPWSRKWPLTRAAVDQGEGKENRKKIGVRANQVWVQTWSRGPRTRDVSSVGSRGHSCNRGSRPALRRVVVDM